ncbi:hypothetical protein COEX109129_36535 [Corallococcus exiguus]
MPPTTSDSRHTPTPASAMTWDSSLKDAVMDSLVCSSKSFGSCGVRPRRRRIRFTTSSCAFWNDAPSRAWMSISTERFLP